MKYLTTKIVTAWAEDRQDQPGYAVLYDDGYKSWCPAAPFEASSLALGYVDHLAPHEVRLVAELEQTIDRLDKLEAFMGTERYEALPDDDRELLKAQYDIMGILAGVLNERVEKLGSEDDDE